MIISLVKLREALVQAFSMPIPAPIVKAVRGKDGGASVDLKFIRECIEEARMEGMDVKKLSAQELDDVAGRIVDSHRYLAALIAEDDAWHEEHNSGPSRMRFLPPERN